MILIPPHQSPTGPRNPLRPGTQLEDWACHIVLCNSFLMPPYILPKWEYTHHLYNLFCRSTFLFFLPDALGRLPHYPPHCDLSFCCCLTILLPSVGLDIMGYESDSLPTHRWLRNRSYTSNFNISTFVNWSLYLLSHNLTPPSHTSDAPIIISAPVHRSCLC